MQTISLKKRKQSLKKIALNGNSNGAVLYKLINDGSIDHVIEKIDDKKTYTNSTAVVKKGYLTGNEQFIDILSEFYYYFESNFITLQHKDWYFSCLLKNKTPKFLLCKNYWGNNDFIDYYKYNMQKLIAENIYDNIKFVYDNFQPFFKDLKITKRLSMRNEKSIDLIFNFAIDLVWCNCNHHQYYFNYIFPNYKSVISEFKVKHKNKSLEAENIVKKDYIIHWDTLIENYLKNIDSIKSIL